jgi:hypothetical protein
MKNNLYKLFLVLVTILAVNALQAQDKFAYTVTDSVQNGTKWNYIRKINLQTGAFSNILLRLLSKNDTVANTPLFNGVAAIGYDDKSNRLYFTPMLVDRLSYVDLKTLKIYLVTNSFTGTPTRKADQSNVLTRMVIAKNNNGYALTNDANQLVKFNTRNNIVRNLGALIDAPGNSISVHEVCSSFGGDLIADEEESTLYLITARNHVFKINIENRQAKYLGTINGLPTTFTTSGAAVDYRSNKRVIITSSGDKSDIFTVDFKSLQALGLHSPNVWLSSDLANSNYISIKDEDEEENKAKIFVSNNNLNNNKIKLYPNPVTNNQFKIQFTDVESGMFTIDIIDVLGQVILTKTVNTTKNNIASITIPELTSKGILIVRITNKDNNAVYSEKIILQ